MTFFIFVHVSRNKITRQRDERHAISSQKSGVFSCLLLLFFLLVSFGWSKQGTDPYFYVFVFFKNSKNQSKEAKATERKRKGVKWFSPNCYCRNNKSKYCKRLVDNLLLLFLLGCSSSSSSSCQRQGARIQQHDATRRKSIRCTQYIAGRSC